jgi:signal transduction histidine kinase
MQAGASFTLGVRPHKVQISYIGLSLSSPDRVRYRYQLEHEDAGWQEGGADRVVSYTNLAPGSYRFLVSARNSDGVWSQASAVSAFSIPPAFTQTWTFFAACLLAAIVLLWSVYALRMRHVTVRLQERMRDRTSERLRIARDLHDTLLQGVQGLVMRLHFTAAEMPEQDTTRRTLMSALDRADEVLEESRNSLLQLRSEEDADLNFAETIRSLATQLLRNSDATFTFRVDGEPRPLQPLVHEEASFIFREALTNAIQHSGAENMQAVLTYAPEELRLQFRDDGAGLSPLTMKIRRRQGHWGMQGMRERAARIGGKIDITGAPGEGTAVELQVTGRAAYLPDPSWSPLKRTIRALTTWRWLRFPAKHPQ